MMNDKISNVLKLKYEFKMISFPLDLFKAKFKTLILININNPFILIIFK
jgi:hypothetical protein